MMFYWHEDFRKWGTNANNTRAELKKGGNFSFTDGDLIWEGWSIFLPDELSVRQWAANTHTNQSINQYHDDPGGTQQLMARNSQWEWGFGTLGKQFCGAIEFGKWTDFVQCTYVSSGNDGLSKVWIDADSDADTPVYNRTGRTLRSGVNNVYRKIGIYNQDFNSQVYPYIKQYHDCYRYGNSFASVKPGN